MKKILIIAPAWVGDLVMSQSLLKALKQQDPNVIIDVVAPEWNFPIVLRMTEVNEGIAVPFRHGKFDLIARLKIAKELRNKGYQQAIVLPNSWKSALLPFLAKIKVRTGWCGEYRIGLLNDMRYLEQKLYPTMVERYVALAYPKHKRNEQILPPTLQSCPGNVTNLCKKFALNDLDKVLALCPGAAFGDAKCWPAQHFIKLAKLYINKGWQVWLFGAPKEQKLLHYIQRQASQKIKVFASVGLLDKIDLLSLADTVVCNDSGLMHIAAGLGKKIVAIYGSTSHKFTPPLSKDAVILNKNLDCSPCFKRKCPLGHHQCMVNITPEEVDEAIGS